MISRKPSTIGELRTPTDYKHQIKNKGNTILVATESCLQLTPAAINTKLKWLINKEKNKITQLETEKTQLEKDLIIKVKDLKFGPIIDRCRLRELRSDSKLKPPSDSLPCLQLKSEKSGIITGRKKKRAKRGDIGMDHGGRKRAIHADGDGVQVPLETT